MPPAILPTGLAPLDAALGTGGLPLGGLSKRNLRLERIR